MQAAFDAGETEFKFESSIYGAKSVKNALKKAHHGKCCFCESNLDGISYGDVEHFRPKGGWVQNRGDALNQPGYFWLAYDWSNLFFCCQICNQAFKKNLFPLADPSVRARSHNDDISDEAPLLIHPSDDDAEALIGFRAEVPYAINNNEQARVTIEETGLKRLNSRRAEALGMIRLLPKTIQHLRLESANGNLSDEMKANLAALEKQLQELIHPQAEYSSMMKWALRDVLPADE